VYGRGQRSPGLGIGPPVTPPIVKRLLIALAVIFLAQHAIPGLLEYGALRPALVWQHGYLWQPFTYMWLHAPLPHFGHVAMNCFALWMFGSQLALAWGARRFLRYYLLCGVGAGLFIASWPYVAVGLGMADPLNLIYSTVGASGAIYGVLLAYSLTWPDRTIMLIFPPVAFRAIWLIPLIFFLTFMMDPRGNVSHVGHLGGVIVGWLYLRRSGKVGKLFTLNQLKYRWRRYRMRQKLRAVRNEEFQARRRQHDRDDHTLH